MKRPPFQTILISCIAFLFIGCDDNNSNKPKTDFIQIDLPSTKIYQTISSKDQWCMPSNLGSTKVDFNTYKSFYKAEEEFQWIALNIRKDGASICPITRIEDGYSFTFILSKGSGDDFIDFYNSGGIEEMQWTQELYQGKILLKGTFEGWLYQWYKTRKLQGTEPRKQDSLFIKNGRFQFTFE